MSEYHLVPADKDGASIAVFDAWPAAKRAWREIRDKRNVRLLCMWPCGCVRQAVRVRTHADAKSAQHSGWRRVEVCPSHARTGKAET